MGLTFRGAKYQRKTWCTKRTVKDGEACVIWSLGGKATQIIGPKRIQTWFSTIQFLDRVTAGPFEFLVVEKRSGAVEHLRGPRSMWVNPIQHSRVSVMQATHLASAAEGMVVYVAFVGDDAAALGKDAKPSPAPRLFRTVVRGPKVYCPAFGERVHKFSWTEGGTKRDFESIKLGAPIMLKLNAPLHSSDGGGCDVSVNVAVVIDDVEKLLDGSEDLPKDLNNALASDLVALGRDCGAEALRNLGGFADELKKGAAALAVLHKRCAELGVRLQSVELGDSTPSPELRRRWAAADDEARLVRDASKQRVSAKALDEAAAAAAVRDAAAAAARHEADVVEAQRSFELDELRSSHEESEACRQHAMHLSKATRALSLDAAEADVAKGRLVTELHRAQMQCDHDGKAARAVHDEEVRYLGELLKGGVETKDLLKSPHGAETGSLDALVRAALQKA